MASDPVLQRPRRVAAGGSGVRRELIVFLTVGLLAMGVIAFGTVLVSRQVARDEALRDAEVSTARMARVVMEPLLSEALFGDPARRDELDRAVAVRLSDDSLTAVTVWSVTGEILYSGDPSIIGRRIGPSPEVLRAAQQGRRTSVVDDQTEPAGSGAEGERYLEVYVPLRIEGLPPMAFEAYYSYDRVDAQIQALTGRLVPMAVGALVVLQLVQVPIAWSLARRVGRQRAERSRLAEQALTASERERRAIAADLHDGVVQNLAGVGYALGAVTRSLPPDNQRSLEPLSRVVQETVESLRKLMVDIYPPDLSGPGLAAAVSDLAGALREHDVEVSVEIDPLPEMESAVAALLYRSAREALNNVGHHAGASRLTVRLRPDDDHRWADRAAVLLQVDDDGVGLPATGIDRRAEGHLGLRLLIDAAADLGGRLDVGDREGGGTSLTVRLPTHPDGQRFP